MELPKISHGPTHKSVYKKYPNLLEEYLPWLLTLDIFTAIVAWEIIRNKVDLETIRLAEISDNPITFNRVLWGANLDCIMPGDTENAIRSIALDELKQDFEDWKKSLDNSDH